MREITFLLENEEYTLKAGRNLATILKDFPTIKTLLFFGSLGAGKTTFTRGFVSAFNGSEFAEVSSPTFTLVNQYPTNPQIIHADVYRLAEMCAEGTFPELPEEIEDAIEDPNIFTLIEWAEYLNPETLPIERLDIFLKVGNNSRSLTIQGIISEENAFFDRVNNLLSL